MRTNPQSGVTLLECVAAIVIVGTSIVAGLELFGMHQNVAYTQEQAWTALRYLTDEVERVRAEDVDRLATHDFTPHDDDPDFEIARTVELENTDCVRVTLTIRWSSLSGRPRERSAVTYRCDGT